VAKEPWQMTKAEFAKAADEGQLRKATGKFTAEEKKAKTPLTAGKAAGYSDADIAHFYVSRRGGFMPENKYVQGEIAKGYTPTMSDARNS